MSWHGFVFMLFKFFGICRVNLAGVFWGVGQLLLCSSGKPNEQDIEPPVQLCFITSWFSANRVITFGHFVFLYRLLVLMLKFNSVCRPHAWNSYLYTLTPSPGFPTWNWTTVLHLGNSASLDLCKRWSHGLLNCEVLDLNSMKINPAKSNPSPFHLLSKHVLKLIQKLFILFLLLCQMFQIIQQI